MAQSSGTATLNNNVISKIVGTMWKQEPAEVKAMYAAKAQEEKRVHMLKHPDYKYRPKKSPPKHTGAGGLSRSGDGAAAGHSPKKQAGSGQTGNSNPSRGSAGVGGMGMSANDDFQYSEPNAPQEIYMQQGIYQPTYQINPPFELQQQNWEMEQNAGFMPVYWTSAQLQQQQPN